MLYCIASYHTIYIYVYIISFVDYIWHIVLYHISCCTKISRVSYHFRHIISYQSILTYIVSYHAKSCHIISCLHDICMYLIASLTICHCIVLHCIVLYCIELCCNKSCYVRMLYDIISLANNMCLGHIISCYIMSNNVVRPYCIIMKK